ncbi:MAG: DUF4395 domain-containing protein [Thiovulaceae bacterium]|nr:DUF4395 domain-containing protein [Sulfurimonadaceae bacterium]MDD3817073.1 DUF4395 domain-containing protein [Sulfurimonadaceae bacterium]
MSFTCPLSFTKIDTNVARLNTLLASSLVTMYLFYDFVMILFFLVYDFGVKLFAHKKYSPLYISARGLKKLLRLKPALADAGAKRLANYFALFFMILLASAHYLQNAPLVVTLASIYLACAFLDIVFNYCIGCKVYYVIKKIYPPFMEKDKA